MRNSFLIFILSFLVVPLSYSKVNECIGKVTWVMADHPECVDRSGTKQLAFKIEGSKNWKCNGSDNASALILKAKAENATVGVYLNNEGCRRHSNYVRPEYTIYR